MEFPVFLIEAVCSHFLTQSSGGRCRHYSANQATERQFMKRMRNRYWLKLRSECEIFSKLILALGKFLHIFAFSRTKDHSLESSISVHGILGSKLLTYAYFIAFRARRVFEIFPYFLRSNSVEEEFRLQSKVSYRVTKTDGRKRRGFFEGTSEQLRC